jgi:predicted dehydrogenase
VIATPVPTHYILAKQALEAGKHVLVEKPPAMRAGEMEELVDLARDRNRVLMPGHLLLYHPGVRALKDLIDEEPSECVAHGRDFLTGGVEDVVFCYLRFPSGKIAHMHLSWLDPHKMRRMTVVGDHKMAVFDDMELERKVTVYEKAPWEPAQTYGEWRTRTGDIFSPKIPNDEPLRLELQHFLRLVEEGPGDHREALDGLAVVRALDRLTESLRGG